MSTFTKPKYTENGMKNQFLNCIVGLHDLTCCCESPLTHAVNIIFEKAAPTNFTEKEKLQIKKCLGEEDTKTMATTEDDGFGPGDLDQLFAAAADEGEEK